MKARTHIMNRFIAALALLTALFATACDTDLVIHGKTVHDPHSQGGNITNNDCGAKSCKDAH
jgi:hypothetical protein